MKISMCVRACCAAVSTIVVAHTVSAENQNTTAVHDDLEEVIVTAPFQKNAAQTALPVGVLSGDELRAKVASSLGETLKGELGVNSASFGPGVGQPIIRGQSGKRVQILQNGVALTDASAISADHSNALEPLLADRIEVVRGPATLLYGSGAIGGVVNVIDQRIPSKLLVKPRIVAEQSHSNGADENKTLLGVTTSVGRVSMHFDGYYRDNNDVEVKGRTVLGDVESTSGFIDNSNGRSLGVTAGLSWILENGFVGVSAARSENQYGLPPASHSHHDEDEAHGEEEQSVNVRIAMEQSRYDVKSKLAFETGFFTEFSSHLAYTDYEHRELEIEEGVSLVGTVFKNSGIEGRGVLNHRSVGFLDGAVNGIWGMQFSDTEFSAIGDEGFIPKTDITRHALFVIERFEKDQFTAEVGFRIERSVNEPSACKKSDLATSFSASVLYDVSESTNFRIAAAKSERAATVEERYSNIDLATCGQYDDVANLVLHAATALIEVGNPELDGEVSNNLEFGLRHELSNGELELSVFYNQISDYIYLQHTEVLRGDEEIAAYVARDANFTGLETAFSRDLSDNVSLRLFADLVHAKFDKGGYVPRVPAARTGFGVEYHDANWLLKLDYTHVFEQNNAAQGETKSDDYQLLSLYADQHWQVYDEAEFVVFLKADNVLNQTIRNHASLLKQVAPESGRSVTLGMRLLF